MRKPFKKVATVAIIAVATIVTAITFQSCSQETDSVSPSETKLTTEQAFANDLQKLADAQRKFAKQLTANAFSRRAGEVPTDSLGIPDDCQEAAQEVAEIIGEIAQNYDLTEDLTEHEKEGLTIDEETREIMCLDHEAFLAYVEEYKSEEYYNIIVSMFQDSSFIISIEDIIMNDNLKMNEKVDLIAMTSMDKYLVDDNPYEPEPMGPVGYEVVTCESKYKNEKIDCLREFEIEIFAISQLEVWTAGLTTPEIVIGLGAAGAKYIYCNHVAKRNYNDCVTERNANKK